MSIKKLKKKGMHNIYQTEYGVFWIGNCTNADVYTVPGHYIGLDNPVRLPKELYQKAFKTPMQAIKCVVRFLSGKEAKI